MALAHSPSIPTNGLMLYLDAANPKSYPGTGTTWTDLSGNGRNGSIFNGPTYSSNNAGYFVFDGSNDYIDITDTGNQMNWTPTGALGMSNMTIEMWINSTDTGGIYYTKPWNGGGEYNIFVKPAGIDLYTGGSNSLSIAFGRNVSDGTWSHLVCCFSPTQVIYRINYDQYTGTNNHTLSYTTPTSGVNNIPTGLMTLYPYGSGWAGLTGFSIQGNMSVTKVYNRILTSAEILQNFNALRGRYGI